MLTSDEIYKCVFKSDTVIPGKELQAARAAGAGRASKLPPGQQAAQRAAAAGRRASILHASSTVLVEVGRLQGRGYPGKLRKFRKFGKLGN